MQAELASLREQVGQVTALAERNATLETRLAILEDLMFSGGAEGDRVAGMAMPAYAGGGQPEEEVQS